MFQSPCSPRKFSILAIYLDIQMPTLSQRGLVLPASPIRKLAAFAEQAKQKGIQVLHLNIGQPDIKAPEAALRAVQQSSLDLLPYGPSQGTTAYRTKLCRYYKTHNIELEPDQILVTTGASEAIYFTFSVLCDAEDEVIIPEPSYANYNGFAAAAHVKVVPVVARFEDQFKLPDIAAIAAKITPKTKAILICNPSNPTGYLYSSDEIAALGELALKHDLYLIVDEVYREFVYDGATHYSVLQNKAWRENAIMIDSVSKRYSLCGARVGCIVSRNKAFMDVVLKFAHLRLSPATYALMASEAALEAPEEYYRQVVEEYTHRREVLVRALEQINGLKVSKPKGAFYCIASLPVPDAEAFAKFLLTDFSDQGATVMLAPAAGFYSDPSLGKNQVRIAFVLEAAKLQQAAAILKKGLEAYLKS